MQETRSALPNREVVVNTLAITGFIALIGASMWLAVYSTRYVPSVVGEVGSAAVYLGSVFTPAEKPALSVVPTASTTIAFGEDANSTLASSTLSRSVSSGPVEVPAPARVQPVAPVAGSRTTSVTVLDGLSDLAVKINAIGYLATSSADSFVASSTVPASTRPAVHFTIKNVGVNVTRAWHFTASIPTQTEYLYTSPAQQALAPGDSIEYTMGFDQPVAGTNQTIVITANPDHAFTESSFTNNAATTTVTVLGS